MGLYVYKDKLILHGQQMYKLSFHFHATKSSICAKQSQCILHILIGILEIEVIFLNLILSVYLQFNVI